MYFSTTNQVILEYIGVLQDFFKNDPALLVKYPDNPSGLAGDYRWNEDPSQSKIWISDEFPDIDKIRPPYIIVNGSSGSSQELDFGQFVGYVEDKEGNTYERFGGIFGVNMEFYVVGLTTAERAEVADLLVMCLVHRKRQELINKSIVPRSTRAGGMSEEPYGNGGKIFIVQVSQAADVHWYYDAIVDGSVESIDIHIETKQGE